MPSNLFKKAAIGHRGFLIDLGILTIEFFHQYIALFIVGTVVLIYTQVYIFQKACAIRYPICQND